MGDQSNLDDAAAKLQAKADEVLKETGSDEAAAKKGGKTQALRNIAKQVKSHAEKGYTDSREYITKVVENVKDSSSTASSKYQELKSQGLSTTEAAKQLAAENFSTAKDAAQVHAANVHANVNKAIAQGQARGSDSTVSGTTDRDFSTQDSETLSWPYSWIAWVVSLCGGKGGSTTSSSSSSASTDKGLSTDSLQNAAAALTKELDDATKSKASGSEES